MPDPNLIGRKIGHYEVTARLGSGGMGEVYSATDTRLNRPVALKILPPELSDDPERLHRFEREARTVAALSHPNIVTIYSVEHAGDLHFLTMERVEGCTLDALIAAGGMPVDEFFDVAIPLVEAVRSAHDRGVSHRDLKPSNVMVDDNGHLKVLDFGLAKMTQPTGPDGMSRMATSDLTREGRIVGTVAYMSPEQAEGKPLDHRTDIFSLGILLYEMLAGARPFGGDTNIAVLSSILKDSPRPLHELRPGLPASLGRIVERALHKQPGDRYGTARELRDDLAALRRDLDSGDLARVAAARSPHAPEPAQRRRPSAREMVAGLALVAAMATAAWFLRPTPPPGDADREAPTAAGVATPLGDERQSVAVLYFDNLSGDAELDWLRGGLADMLITDLSESPRLRVLGTDRLYQILGELGHLEDATTSFAVVQAVADAAGAERVIVGSFLRAGSTLRISARLQEPATGDVLVSETVESAAEDALFDLVDQLAARLRARLLGETLPATAIADAGPAGADTPGGGAGGTDPRDSETSAGNGTAADTPSPAPAEARPEPAPETTPAVEPTPPAPAVGAVTALVAPDRTIRQVTTGSVEAFKNYSRAIRTADEAGPAAAIPLLEQALIEDPDFALALARLSDLHASLGDEETARAYAQEALDREERLPRRDRLYLEGRIKAAGDPDAEASLAAYRQTLEAFPDHTRARGDLAIRLFEQERFDEAMVEIERMDNLGVDAAWVSDRLAHVVLAPGKRDQERARIESLLAIQPDNAALQGALAEVAAAAGDAAAAQQALAAARRLAPGSPELIRTSWRVPALLGDMERARAAAAGMVDAADPDLAFRGAMAMAVLAQFDGDPEAALGWFDRAARAAPAGNVGGWQPISEAVRMLLSVPDPGRTEARIRDAERSALPPQRVFLSGARAIAAAQSGDAAEAARARAAFEQMLRRSPQPPSARERLQAEVDAAIAMAQNEPARALEHLQRARQPLRGAQPPGFVEPRLLEARALWLTGRPREARPLLLAVLEDAAARLQSPLPWVRSLYYLGAISRAEGDADAARGYFTRFVESWNNGALDRDLVRDAREWLSRQD